MTEKNGGFRTFIYTISISAILGFAGLCIAGYFDLDSKVAMAKEKSETARKEIRKEIKDDLTDMNKKLERIIIDLSKIEGKLDK